MGVFFLGNVAPQVGNDLAQVYARDLPHVGFGVVSEEEKEVFNRFDRFEVLLQEGRGLFDDLGVRLEELAQDLGQAVRVKVLEDGEVNLWSRHQKKSKINN